MVHQGLCVFPCFFHLIAIKWARSIPFETQKIRFLTKAWGYGDQQEQGEGQHILGEGTGHTSSTRKSNEPRGNQGKPELLTPKSASDPPNSEVSPVSPVLPWWVYPSNGGSPWYLALRWPFLRCQETSRVISPKPSLGSGLASPKACAPSSVVGSKASQKWMIWQRRKS